MDNKEISILILENMNSFYNLIKTVNKDRYKIEKTLTEKQFFALWAIKRHQKMELKNLSRELKVTTSSLCILLNKLVEKEYVYREEDQSDRRNTFYGITETGKAILNKEIGKFLDIIGLKVKELEEDDLKKLLNAMKEMNEIMDKFSKK